MRNNKIQLKQHRRRTRRKNRCLKARQIYKSHNRKELWSHPKSPCTKCLCKIESSSSRRRSSKSSLLSTTSNKNLQRHSRKLTKLELKSRHQMSLLSPKMSQLEAKLKKIKILKKIAMMMRANYQRSP